MSTLSKLIKKSPLRSIPEMIKRSGLAERQRKQFWQIGDEDQKRREFYQAFFSPSELVFDVGANSGNRSKIFCQLGADVVAFEPQAICQAQLKTAFAKTKNFVLESVALGESRGSAEMFICNASTISSLSPAWISAVQESGRFADHQWNQTQTVAVETLDQMIEKYGRPKFCKIDVEGFELQVVKGLNQPVGGLSLEFAPEFLKQTLLCIDHLDRIGDWKFQFSEGETMFFSCPEWMDSNSIRQLLVNFPVESFGDLYAKAV